MRRLFLVLGVLAFLLPLTVSAQIAPAQNQVTIGPFGGLVMGTSTSGTKKLEQLIGNTFGQLAMWNGSKWTTVSTSSLGINGSGTVSSVTTTYPVQGGPITTTGNISLAFGTTTANTWSSLQTFSYASSTGFSMLYASSTAYFGAGLADCNTGSFLQWTSGRFGCATPAASGGGTGVATTSFLASDFDTSVSNISIDYVNGQKASASLAGFMTAANFTLLSTPTTTFSGALAYNLATNGVTCTTATASVAGCVAAADFATFSAKLSAYDAWTHGSTYSTTTAATTTSLWTQGVYFSSSTKAASQFPYASTTAISTGALFVGTDGVTDITGSGLSISGGALNVSGLSTTNFSSSNISQWTNDSGYITSASIPGQAFTFGGNNFGTSTAATTTSIWTKGIFFSSSTVAASQFPYASTTALTAVTASTTDLIVSNVQSALFLGDTAGKATKYSGSGTCSASNFVTSISSTGVTTCGTGTIDGVPIGGTLSTLAVSGSITGTSYNGSAAVSDWTLNMANANTWTAKQTFAYASSTGISTSGQASTTDLVVSNVQSALFLGDASGKAGKYGGSAPCTNQVALSLSATGIITCTSVSNAMLTNSGAINFSYVGNVSGTASGAPGGTVTITSPWTWASINVFGTTSIATTTSIYTVGSFFSSSTQASQFTYASTTGISVSGTASTTNLIVSGLNAASCDVKASVTGVLSCGVDATGGGSSFPFTPTTYGSSAVNATSTALWLTATPISLFASSSLITYATSTYISTEVASTSRLILAKGAQGTPSLSFDSSSNTGIYGSGTQIGIVSAGNAVLVSNGAQAQMNSGTVAAPGIAFVNDSNNGIWSAKADTINFSTNGAERVRIGQDGSIGISTTSPWALFSINTPVAASGATTTLFVIASSTNSTGATTTLFSVDNTGAASTTLFYGAQLSSCTGSGNKVTWASGTFRCEADQTGAGGGAAFPFTSTTNFGALANSTGTPIWFTAGLQSSSTVTFGSAGGTVFRWDNTNGRLGIGTIAPAEMLHLLVPTGSFATMRIDSGSTQGYLWAYDGDDSINMGSKSDSQFNFKQNNGTKGYIDNNGLWYIQNNEGNHTWFTVDAPSASPQESTLTTRLTHSAGNSEFVDWTTENYGTDWQHSINIAKAGTGVLLPFSLRFWNSDLANIAVNGVYAQTWLPNGTIGFGVSTSTAGGSGTGTLLYAASSTAPTLFKLDAAPGTTRFQVSSAGTASTTDLIVSNTATVGTNALNTVVSFISNSFSHLFTVGTTTTSKPLFDVSATSTNFGFSFARVAVGTSTVPNSGDAMFWPLTVDGPIYSTYLNLTCGYVHAMAGLTADSAFATVCNDFLFDEDSQGATSGENPKQFRPDGTPFKTIWAGATAVNTASVALGDGGGVVPIGSNSLAFAFTASSSPVFEALVAASTTNATSTTFQVGLVSSGQGSDFGSATADTVSQFAFLATSTTNWMAIGRENGQNAVEVDTGVSSTTAKDGFQKMNVFVVPAPDQSTIAYYYIDNKLVATISGVKASSAGRSGLVPMVSVGAYAAGNAKAMDVGYIRAWWRKTATQ